MSILWYFFIYLGSSVAWGMKASDSTVHIEKASEKTMRYEQLIDAAQLIFNPIDLRTRQPNPYPTVSRNEKIIERIFGSVVSTDLLTHIKIFYFYLEYATKVQKAAQLVHRAKKAGIEYESLVQNGNWELLNNRIAETSAGVVIKDSNPDAQDFIFVLSAINQEPWMQLIQTRFWKEIEINDQDLQQSELWQLFVKITIVDSIDKDQQYLELLEKINLKLFRYVPSMDITYYHQDCATLRHAAAFARLTLQLHDHMRLRSAKDLRNEGGLSFEELIRNAEVVRDLPLYRMAANGPAFLKIAAQQNSALPEDIQTYFKQPMHRIYAIGVAMAKNIQAQLFTLFKEPFLKKALTLLDSAAGKTMSPSLLPYGQDDALYIKELVYLEHFFEQVLEQQNESILDTSANTVSAPSKKSVVISPGAKQTAKTAKKVTLVPQGARGWWSKNWQDDFKKWTSEKVNVIKTAAKESYAQLKQAATDFTIAITDGGHAVKDQFGSLWEGLKGVGCILSDNLSAAKEHIQKSKQLQNAVVDDLKKVTDDTKVLLQSINKAVKGSTAIIGESVGIVFNAITTNKNIGEAMSGILRTGLSGVVDVLQLATVDLLLFVPGVSAVIIDALNTITKVIASSVRVAVDRKYDSWGADVVNQLAHVGNTIVATLFQSCTFLIANRGMGALQEAVQLAGYLTLMLTEVTVDQVSAQLFGIAQIAGSAKGDFMQAINEVNEHKRFIATVANNALIIGVTLMTDGATLPVLITNSLMQFGFTAGSLVGTFQDDEYAQEEQAEQKTYIQQYGAFIKNSKQILENETEQFNTELHYKLNTQINNNERELYFYQAFLQQFINQTKEQMAFQFGSKLVPYLIPDPTLKLRKADVGSLYGFATGNEETTGILDLNMGNGFLLYNKARNALSQEVAVYPEQLGEDGLNPLWFNLKDTVPLEKQPTKVRVRFKVLRTLEHFILGLCLGNDAFDVRDIIEHERIPFTMMHGAKMIVYRFIKNDPRIVCKIYEHEGREWQFKSPPAPELVIGEWYIMEAALIDDKLMVKVWKEGSKEPESTTYKVMPFVNKTIGFITAGASVEYQYIQPAIPINAIPTVRKPIEWEYEKARHQKALSAFEQLCNPTLGSYKFKAIEKEEIIKGNFIYSREGEQKPKSQYIIFAQDNGDNTINNIGCSPETLYRKESSKELSPDAVFVDLLTGEVYDFEGKLKFKVPYIMAQYNALRPSLSDTIRNAINQENKALLQKMAVPINFGAINLIPSGVEDMQQGIFVYKGASPDPLLQNKEDYFIVVDKEIMGIPLTEQSTIIQSLVSGNRYTKNQTEPIDDGYLTGIRGFSAYVPHSDADRPNALMRNVENAAKEYDALWQQKYTSKKVASKQEPQQPFDAPSEPVLHDGQVPQLQTKGLKNSLSDTIDTLENAVAWGS